MSEGEEAGVRIIQKAIKIPLMKIAENAGYEGSLIAAKLLEEGNRSKGFDASNGKYVDMKDNGIIDPTKVVKSALIDSSSVASLMLTTECMIYD